MWVFDLYTWTWIHTYTPLRYSRFITHTCIISTVCGWLLYVMSLRVGILSGWVCDVTVL